PRQGIAPEVGGLRARHGVGLGDDKEGYALDAQAVALLLEAHDGVEAGGVAQCPLDTAGGKAAFPRPALKLPPRPDIEALLEVGVEQALQHGVLPTLPAGLPNY